MPRPNDVGVGTAIILFHKGKIVLGKRKGAHRAGYFSLPGGWLEREDVNTNEAAARECFEETGIYLDFDDVNPIGWTHEDHPEIGCSCITLFHRVDMEEAVDPRLMEPEKCEGWAWYNLENFLRNPPGPLFPGLEHFLRKTFHIWE